MATLGELQEQLATLKERYSAVIEGSYSAEESIATIAVNMQAQLDDAQAAASSAGTYAAIAENAADEAAVAGAEAGAAAGTTAGASAAQTKYDDIFTQRHTWDAPQEFYSLNVTKQADFSYLEASKGQFYSLIATNVDASKGQFYSLSTPKMEVVDVHASEVDVSTLKIRDEVTDTRAQFNASYVDQGVRIDIAGYAQYSDGTQSRINTTLSVYSAGCEYISAYDAISAPDVLAGSMLILGAHLANDAELGTSYDGRGTVLKTDLYPDHNYVTLHGQYFPNGGIYDVYLSAYSADFKYLAAEHAISIDGVSINKTELQQLKSLSAPTDYYADSYFENLWAAKRTDDIYVRRINKFAYDPAPRMLKDWASVPRTVNLELKDGGTRNYENALHTLFATADKDINPYCIPATDVTTGYDPVKDVLVGFWERCNYYKDSNGDVRITAVRGDDNFDKRKADVGTFGPTLWFDIRDSLEKDTSGVVMYTDIIVSTAPHPELGLHPIPLAMRSDGTVAPYWCCSAYPAGTKDYQLVSAYGSNIELKKYNLLEGYSDSKLSLREVAEYCRNRGKGYGGGIYINFLVQLMFLLKYGTKDSQSVFKGVSSYSKDNQLSFNVDNNITKADLSYDLDRGAHWIPIAESTANLYSFLYNAHAVTVKITSDYAGNRGLPDNDTPLPILDIVPVEVSGNKYYKLFLETEYSILLQSGDSVMLSPNLAPAGTTDRVLLNYDGVSGYSAWNALKEGLASSTVSGSVSFSSTIFQEPTYPFRIHGIEYGVHGEIFMDKVWQSYSETSSTTGYYRLPWEEKELTTNTTYTTAEFHNVQGYGADYATLVVKSASDAPVSEYDVVIGVPVPLLNGVSSATGLCDAWISPQEYNGLAVAIGWNDTPSGGASAGLFCYECGTQGGDVGWYSGVRL